MIHVMPCLIWAGPFDDKMFPRFGRAGENYSAIRVAWFLAYGVEPPRDREVIHTCPNMACIEPSHLAMGDLTDTREFKSIPKTLFNSEGRFWASAA